MLFLIFQWLYASLIRGTYIELYKRIMVTRSRAHNILSNTLLLAVYVAFIVVQVFFNFDTLSNPPVSFKNSFSINFIKGHQESVEKGGNHSSKKFNIRLNKRFQPEGIPGINTGLNDPFAEYISLVEYSIHNSMALSAVFLSRSLRAPPVNSIACFPITFFH